VTGARTGPNQSHRIDGAASRDAADRPTNHESAASRARGAAKHRGIEMKLIDLRAPRGAADRSEQSGRPAFNNA
jgi:hypothetical protein